MRLAKNTGSSGGFYEGMRLAFEHGHEWIWVMDDDVLPQPDCLENLMAAPQLHDASTGALAAVVRCPDGEVEYRSRSKMLNISALRPVKIYEPAPDCRDIVPINCSTFVALLINRRAVAAVGLPISEFFIAFDDIEYMARIARSGFKSYLVCGAAVVHYSPAATKLKKRFLPAYIQIPKGSLWKAYCGYRNRAYFISRYCGPLVFCRELVRHAAAILIYDDCKLRRLRLLVRGFWHGITGRLLQTDVDCLFAR